MSDERSKNIQVYTTSLYAKDPEVEQDAVDGWYDVNQEENYIRIGNEHVAHDKEEGTENSGNSVPVGIGSRVSRSRRMS